MLSLIFYNILYNGEFSKINKKSPCYELLKFFPLPKEIHDVPRLSPLEFSEAFENELSTNERRKGGMHYSSVDNIHRVIDPLFTYQLYKEFTEIMHDKKALDKFHDKLANLTFLDPACGSGNFLIVTYEALKELEHKVLTALDDGRASRVSTKQFYGIEIDERACAVARASLYLCEPVETKNIICGNALQMDWQKVDYIIGNPPFRGYSNQTKEQKADMLATYVDEKGKRYNTAGRLDYVAGWLFKASEQIHNTNTAVAFVTTKSITQGQQTTDIWKPIIERFKVKIDFAYRPFKWDRLASVHCVIVGFSSQKRKTEKVIFV